MNVPDWKTPVKVPRELCIALETVQQNSYYEENYLYGWIDWMIRWCREHGYTQAANWIEEDRRRYTHTLMVGWIVDEDKKDEQIDDSTSTG